MHKEEAGVHYFSSLFKELVMCHIGEIMQVLSLVPNLIIEKMNGILEVAITSEEFFSILTSFKKGKSTDLDGILMKFYLGFYEMLKEDLVKVFHESKRLGKVIEELNSIFIALIPKIYNVASFEEFILISLCNMIYKVILKVITNMKFLLKKIISEEKFGFLCN